MSNLPGRNRRWGRVGEANCQTCFSAFQFGDTNLTEINLAHGKNRSVGNSVAAILEPVRQFFAENYRHLLARLPRCRDAWLRRNVRIPILHYGSKELLISGNGQLINAIVFGMSTVSRHASVFNAVATDLFIQPLPEIAIF